MLGERGTASGRRQEHEKGEGQIPGEQISHRSRRICAIRKGNNGFRWGEIAKGHVSPSFTLWEADHRKRRAKGMRGSFLRGMWGDVLKCTPDNLPQKRICMSSYWTLTLSFLKKIKKIKVHTNVCFLQSILFTGWDNCWSFCFFSPLGDTDADTNWQFIEFGRKFWHTCCRANGPRGRRGASETTTCDCEFTGSIPAIVMRARHQDNTSGFAYFFQPVASCVFHTAADL